MVLKKRWSFNKLVIIPLVIFNLGAMEAPEQTEKKEDLAHSILPCNKLKTLHKIVTCSPRHTEDWVAQHQTIKRCKKEPLIIEFMSNLDDLYTNLMEKEVFYNVEEQLNVLPQWYNAPRLHQKLVTVACLLKDRKVPLSCENNPLIKSLLIFIYPLISNKETLPTTTIPMSDLPDYLKAFVTNGKSLLDCYNQLNKLSKIISIFMTDYSSNTHRSDGIQKHYIEFFSSKRNPVCYNPFIFLPLQTLKNIYNEEKGKLLERRKAYAKIYTSTEGILNLMERRVNNFSEPSPDDDEKTKNHKAKIIDTFNLLARIFAYFPRECYTQDELDTLKRKDEKEKKRLDKFLPEHLAQQPSNTRKGKNAKKKSNRRNPKTNIFQESSSNSKSIENSSSKTILKKFNNELQKTIGDKEYIVDLYNTLAIITRGPFTYNIYNLSTDNCHMVPDYNPPEPLFDNRIDPWHEEKPEEYARKLNPEAKPEKITEQTWRHIFPYACLRYFAHFGIYKNWKDRKGIDRKTQQFFVEIIIEDKFYKEGIFTVGYDIHTNYVYHTYFYEMSYYDFLEKLSHHKLPEISQEFFEHYYDNNFPQLSSSSSD